MPNVFAPTFGHGAGLGGTLSTIKPVRAALASRARLSVTATMKPIGVTLAGQGTLSASAFKFAKASLAGQGTFSAVVLKSVNAALTGHATLSAVARRVVFDAFAQAMASSSDTRRRAELGLQLGRALNAQGRHEEAAGTYDTALAELPAAPEDPDVLELHDQLEASYISTASIVPDLQPLALERSTRVVEHAVKGPRTQGQRLLLAQAALHATTTGESAHNAVGPPSARGTAAGLPFEANPQWIGWRLVAAAPFPFNLIKWRNSGIAEHALKMHTGLFLFVGLVSSAHGRFMWSFQ